MPYFTTGKLIFRAIAEDKYITESDRSNWINERLNNCIPQIFKGHCLYWLTGKKKVNDKVFAADNILLYRELKVKNVFNEEPIRDVWVLTSYNNLYSVDRFLKLYMDEEGGILQYSNILCKGKLVRFQMPNSSEDFVKCDLWEVRNKKEGFIYNHDADIQHFWNKSEVEQYLLGKSRTQCTLDYRVIFWGEEYCFDVYNDRVVWGKTSPAVPNRRCLKDEKKVLEFHFDSIKELEDKLKNDGLSFEKTHDGRFIIKEGKINLTGYALKSDFP